MFGALESALQDNEPNGVAIHTDEEQLRVFGAVFVGGDFIEFQPQSQSHKRVVIPFSRIRKLTLDR
jgi:hypothetical protein